MILVFLDMPGSLSNHTVKIKMIISGFNQLFTLKLLESRNCFKMLHKLEDFLANQEI